MSAASGRPRSRHLASRVITGPCLTIFQKKLLAERNIRFPPRLRNCVTAVYSWDVTYSWWPSKIRSW